MLLFLPNIIRTTAHVKDFPYGLGPKLKENAEDDVRHNSHNPSPPIATDNGISQRSLFHIIKAKKYHP